MREMNKAWEKLAEEVTALCRQHKILPVFCDAYQHDMNTIVFRNGKIMFYEVINNIPHYYGITAPEKIMKLIWPALSYDTQTLIMAEILGGKE